MAVMNGTGQGGKSFQDRVLAAEVRREGLNNVKLVLSDSPEVMNWSDYKKQLVLKLAPGLLPKLNEHTGADGEPLHISFDPSLKHELTPAPAEDRGV